MRTSKPTSVTLGEKYLKRVEERVKSGTYSSASEVIRAGLRALDREEAALDAYMHEEVRRSLADPRPSIPAEEVFARIERPYEEEVKARQRGA